MRLLINVALAASALGLAGCVSATPVQLPDDHPASPKAASGLVDTATAFADYKSADDFAARAAPDATSSPGGGMPGMQHGMDHGAMPGMDHGDMPGMQHGGAPEGARNR